jgi:hypothetical protein
LQKLVSSLWHTIRAYVSTDELRELGNELIAFVWRHFYGDKQGLVTS